MMNNRGQTLVMFIVFLPLLLIIMATVIDISLMYYEKNKLDNLTMMVTEYGMDHIEDKNIEKKVKKIIVENDEEVKLKKMEIKEKNFEIILSKTTESTFGKIIGIEEYKITSKYIGTNIENKKAIKKG